ncbi:MAG: glycoside hydrolase family 25 protein [Eubacteriales bacterium]|nr:glycoside hydrolase family 25 protein [Eubacteriales bacterium]
MTTYKGIDVSHHNGTINWSKVKAAGIKFAIVRAGYGSNTADNRFDANAKGAIAAGIPIGVYWFSYALSNSDAKAEAKKCLEVIKGYKIDLPVFYDFEYDTVSYAKKHGVTLGKKQFNSFATAFLSEIEKAGYKGGIYYNVDYKLNYVDKSVCGKYVQWLARYASKPGYNCDIWQYSESGTVSGISGKDVDMNILYNADLLPTRKPTYTVGKVYTTKAKLYIRSSAAKGNNVKKKSSVTADAKKNCCLGIKARLKMGTRVTCKEVKIGSDGSVFAKIPSGWILAWNARTKRTNLG